MLKILKRTLSVTLLASAMIVFGSVGFANTDLDQTVGEASLSGSFLASRLAITDQDDAAAVQFLVRANALDPENTKLKQDLLSALVANGKVEEAGKIARDLEGSTTARNLAGFVTAALELKKRSWKEIPGALSDVAGGDLDKTLREVTLAWALAGERKVDEALDKLSDLDGPEWIKVIREYHSGLIADVAGRSDLAAEKYQNVIDNRAVISILTETYVRAIEARVRNRSLNGDAAGAMETLAYGRTILPDHSPFVAMDEQLGKGEVLKLLLTSPQEGAAELFYNIASALRRDDAGSFAKTYLQIANFLSPESDVIQIGLAELYLRQGSYERSNEHYNFVPDISPFYHISRLEKANNLSRLEKIDEAVAELLALIEERPDDLTGYMVLGSLFNREKRYREAAGIFDRATDRVGEPQSHHWNLFFRRGIAYERLKEWPMAESSFQKSLELTPDQPEVLNYLGYSWIDQGLNLDEGMDMIRKAVELRPRSGFIVDSLGWAYYRLGKYEDAVRELERAVDLMPQDPTINDHLGDAYWKVGRKREAVFQWKIALATKMPPDHPEVIKNLSKVFQTKRRMKPRPNSA